MIKLEVEKYCEDCPEFESEVDKDIVELYNSSLRDYIETAETRIYCRHRKRCDNMVNFLKLKNDEGKWI